MFLSLEQASGIWMQSCCRCSCKCRIEQVLYLWNLDAELSCIIPAFFLPCDLVHLDPTMSRLKFSFLDYHPVFMKMN